jgi:signal transduction histidine kinase
MFTVFVMGTRRVILAVGFLAGGVMLAGSVSASAPDKLSAYAYEDTRRLVALVEQAAKLMEEEGESAFAEFGRKGSKWFSEPYYLFVYQPDGTCVFHPLQPDWVGKDMSELRDMNGKPMVQLVAQVGERPEKDASGWVFYLWPDKTQLIPQWKSAYVRKVIAPSGKTYVIGSGVYDIKMEKAFVEERVRMAGELLESQGKDAAFRQFRDPASPFVFLGTFVFVLDTNGHAIVDPAFPTQSGRDLSQFEDAVGRRPVQQILEKLRNNDEAWVQYLWPKPGSSLPSRKLVYVRKARAGDETFIVGSDFFLATPIWMKD